MSNFLTAQSGKIVAFIAIGAAREPPLQIYTSMEARLMCFVCFNMFAG